MKKRNKMMNKYNSEDYFTVRERRTHKKICDCGNFEDARMMMRLDTPNREIVKNKTLMSPVIDVEMPKALPTNEIVVNMDGGVGGSWEVRKPEKLPQIKLPEGQGQPVRV
jgi:hypothetical protein